MLLDYPGIQFSGGNKISHLFLDGEKAIKKFIEGVIGRAREKKRLGISETVHCFSRPVGFVPNLRNGWAYVS